MIEESLPHELLREILTFVADDTKSIARSSCVSHTWHDLCSEPELVQGAALAQQVPAWPEMTWEVLHLSLAVDALGSNQCGFVYASIEFDAEDGRESHVSANATRNALSPT